MPALIQPTTYLPVSYNTFTFYGFKDANLNLLTSATGSAKASMTNKAGTAIATLAAMTYSGTPGQWNFTQDWTKFPDNDEFLIRAYGFNLAGSIQWYQADLLALAQTPTPGYYQRGSQHTFTFSGLTDDTGTLLIGGGSPTGRVMIAAVGSVNGTILASTAMTYSGTPGTWTYTALVGVFPDSDAITVTMSGQKNDGTITYKTYAYALKDNYGLNN